MHALAKGIGMEVEKMKLEGKMDIVNQKVEEENYSETKEIVQEIYELQGFCNENSTIPEDFAKTIMETSKKRREKEMKLGIRKIVTTAALFTAIVGVTSVSVNAASNGKLFGNVKMILSGNYEIKEKKENTELSLSAHSAENGSDQVYYEEKKENTELSISVYPVEDESDQAYYVDSKQTHVGSEEEVEIMVYAGTEVFLEQDGEYYTKEGKKVAKEKVVKQEVKNKKTGKTEEKYILPNE